MTSIPLPAVDFTKVFGSLTTTASNLIPLGLGPPAPTDQRHPKIAALDFPLPSSTAALLSEAVGELSLLGSHSRSAFGSGAPLIGPTSAMLLRIEASSSSQIENLIVGARQLALEPISVGLLNAPATYIAALTEFRRGDALPIDATAWKVLPCWLQTPWSRASS